MIDRLKNSDRYVYHYTSAETAKKIVQTGKLKFGRYTNTNDPKETKQWEFDFGTNRPGSLDEFTREVSQSVSHLIKHGARLLCFSQDQPALSGDHFKDIFYRGYSRPRMWAQYADGHTGVCLVFDRKKLDKCIRAQQPDNTVILEGPVRYVNAPILRNLGDIDPFTINADVLADEGREEYAKIHVRWFFKELFFEKMLDWANEVEYRWVVFDDSLQEKFVDYDRSLAGIVYGDAASVKSMDDLVQLSVNKGVSHLGLKWKNSSPWYDYNNLRLNAALRNSPWGKSSQ